jgi:hypothetical protein
MVREPKLKAAGGKLRTRQRAMIKGNTSLLDRIDRSINRLHTNEAVPPGRPEIPGAIPAKALQDHKTLSRDDKRYE